LLVYNGEDVINLKHLKEKLGINSDFHLRRDRKG